jgi:PAS domain S-box-containing protein
MVRIERIWEEENRVRVLTAAAVIMGVIAAADWWTKPYVSLGFLYLFPIMLAAGFLPRWAIAILGLAGAVLSEAFSSLDKSFVRLGFEALALAGCGLFLAEIVRNRRLSLKAQARLRGLVETSPAGIVTLDDMGLIELANHAAVELLCPRDGMLIGQPIAAFLPELYHAMRLEATPHIRTSMQCQGHRGNGELFLAEVWFSTYQEGSVRKVAAIITAVEDPAAAVADLVPAVAGERLSFNIREREVLRLLARGMANKEIASRLEISESGVKNTLQQLFAKTTVRTRSQLVRVAVEQYRDILD